MTNPRWSITWFIFAIISLSLPLQGKDWRTSRTPSVVGGLTTTGIGLYCLAAHKNFKSTEKEDPIAYARARTIFRRLFALTILSGLATAIVLPKQASDSTERATNISHHKELTVNAPASTTVIPHAKTIERKPNGVATQRDQLLHSVRDANENRLTKDGLSLITMIGDVNTPTHDGRLPLIIAINNGNRELLNHCLAHDAHVNASDASGCTPLTQAADINDLDAIDLLLARGAQINQADANGLTPLCAAHELATVRHLIAKGADVNACHAPESRDPSTALSKAAERGHIQMVHFLLENKATIDAKTKALLPGLFVDAVEHNKFEAAACFLAHGVDIKTLNPNPLAAAIQFKKQRAIAFLETHGAPAVR
ncbi:MAG: hypothetical protein QG604_481 [Candidatus Dependentiae bacterium]|nr:hypothetical protein [Candidatus Dependentiae bacterium]